MIPTPKEIAEYLDITTQQATTLDGLGLAIAKTQVYALLNIAQSLERIVALMEWAKNDQEEWSEKNERR